MISRTDTSLLAEWWRTVDKLMLGLLMALMIFGLLLSFGASPPVAERIGAGYDHFIKRHAIFLLPAIGIMLAASYLSPRQVRRAALILFGIGIIALLMTCLLYTSDAADD